jgi:hypothetical protein
MKSTGIAASTLFGDGRALVIGETNLLADSYNAFTWKSVLGAFMGTNTPGATPRASYVLNWAWMAVPHQAYDDADMRPADVTDQNVGSVGNRAFQFEDLVSKPLAAPRILMSGWGTTFALANQPINAQVRVWVGDLQHDVTSVQVLNSPGTTPLLDLTDAGGGLWTGTLAPAPTPPTKIFRQIRATDIKDTSPCASRA